MADQDSGRRQRLVPAAAILVFVASSLFFFSYHDFGLAWFDEGVLLNGIRLVAQGQMDFARFNHYSAQYRLFSCLFPDGEPDLEVIRLVWVLVRSATAVLILLIATRLVPLRWALLPVVCFLALPGPWHKALVPFALCLCLHAALRTLETGGVLSYCWLAVTIAFAFAMHPYTGAPTLAGWVVVAALTPTGRGGAGDARPGVARVLRWHGAFAVTLALCTLSLADFLRETPVLRLVTDNTGLVASILPGSRLIAAQLLAAATGLRGAMALSIYLSILPTMGLALWLATANRQDGADRGPRETTLCLVVLGLFNLSKWVVRLDLGHLLQNVAPVWILLAFVLRHLWVGARTGQEPSASAAGARAPRLRPLAYRVPAMLLSLWLAGVVVFGVTSTDTFVGGIGTRLLETTAPLAHPHGVLHVRPDVAQTLTRLEELIRANTTRDDSILVCASPQILYYLTGRRSALLLPAFTLPGVYAANPVGELIDEIHASRTKLIVFEDSPVIPLERYRLENLAPRLYATIMTEYGLLAEVDGMQVRLRHTADAAGSAFAARTDDLAAYRSVR